MPNVITPDEVVDQIDKLAAATGQLTTPVVVVDIDDTLLDGSAGPAEYYKPIEPVAEIVRRVGASKGSAKIVVLTARPRFSTIASHRNLKAHDIPFHQIIHNDFDEDPVVFKSRIRTELEEHRGATVIATIGDKVHDLQGPGLLKILVASLKEETGPVRHALYTWP